MPTSDLYRRRLSRDYYGWVNRVRGIIKNSEKVGGINSKRFQKSAESKKLDELSDKISAEDDRVFKPGRDLHTACMLSVYVSLEALLRAACELNGCARTPEQFQKNKRDFEEAAEDYSNSCTHYFKNRKKFNP